MSGAPVVAVTGATGFLGVHLVAALAREGVGLRILARRNPVHDLWRGLAFDVVSGSLEETSALERLVTGADVVVHAAGLIKARNAAEFLRTNRDGTQTIALLTRRHAPAARFVAISSLAAREPQLSDYAASKRAGEEAARAVYADAADRLVILRPPAIYGPWDRETLAIFKAAARPVVPVFGSGRIAMIHAADATRAIVRFAAGAGRAGCYALADTNPAGYAMSEIVGEAARAVGNAPRLVRIPGSALLTAGALSAQWGRLRGHAPIFTAGKAREMLHPDWSVSPHEALPPSIYQSRIGLREGFGETAAWYKTANWLV
ncbi:MAG: NAD-dependent epimerase/dehydratase family protein [Alphaproteobacteria bacterium]|nr:NAD-dependent epimerase/dehydratase family protein [Alphaproteobacteria bacterium]MBU6471877.1 NAD-dependent epimerase/dehydratase family protein [Alphaproteobacteria bacterium]MDE2011751.1 NAD-dependent epimerase/dehydratase family protein [Alphaproteobacteria bacterium]MDE2072953.1 NAD-dependent epimerase/dehydratase family protein [Alphaproteobacteria bacterium]MDE2351843.1 NAD-dependent epimerase/dehydratase family protein [Alphaproteobacteria bacterium]